MKFEIDFESLKKVCDRKLVRKFKDMKKFYRNSNLNGNPLIYTVYIKECGGFEIGLTVIESGTVNKEFYMTKGHRHKNPIDELYILIKGRGKLLLQDKKTKILGLKKNKLYIVPGKAGHRLINTGRMKMEVLTIYSKISGYDYNFKFKKRIMKRQNEFN